MNEIQLQQKHLKGKNLNKKHMKMPFNLFSGASMPIYLS